MILDAVRSSEVLMVDLMDQRPSPTTGRVRAGHRLEPDYRRTGTKLPFDLIVHFPNIRILPNCARNCAIARRYDPVQISAPVQLAASIAIPSPRSSSHHRQPISKYFLAAAAKFETEIKGSDSRDLACNSTVSGAVSLLKYAASVGILCTLGP